jgi:hypothetical protein
MTGGTCRQRTHSPTQTQRYGCSSQRLVEDPDSDEEIALDEDDEADANDGKTVNGRKST